MENNMTETGARQSGRAYLSSSCGPPGSYDHSSYAKFNLLGKRFSYTVDLSAADCGCNAALYLVSMAQNDQPSLCDDYYCDANSVSSTALSTTPFC